MDVADDLDNRVPQYVGQPVSEEEQAAMAQQQIDM